VKPFGVRSAIALLSLCILAGAAGARAEEEGTVIGLSGTVTMLAPGDSLGTPLKIGDAVADGSTLLTADASMAKVVFRKAVLTIGENTELKIERHRYARDTGLFEGIISLGKGMLRSQVDPQEGTGSTFQVKSWNTIAGVRGTDFTVETIPDTFTRVYVYEGAIELRNMVGLLQIVKEREMAEVLKPDGPIRVSPLTDAVVEKTRLQLDEARRTSHISSGAGGAAIPGGSRPEGGTGIIETRDGVSPQAAGSGNSPLNPRNLNVPPAPSSVRVESAPAAARPSAPRGTDFHRKPPPD